MFWTIALAVLTAMVIMATWPLWVAIGLFVGVAALAALRMVVIVVTAPVWMPYQWWHGRKWQLGLRAQMSAGEQRDADEREQMFTWYQRL